MWKYCLDENKIQSCISARNKFPYSVNAATELVRSLGYTEDTMKMITMEDMVFLEGSMDEVYLSKEIEICEKIGKIFYSRGTDIFSFFLIDVQENWKHDAEMIGAIIKIINKAHKGANIIIFQCGSELLFGSRYISKFATRDFHYTFWMSDINIITKFASYSICKKNKNYSYAYYMAYVCKMSLFSCKSWNGVKDANDEIEMNYIELSKKLAYITSNKIDSFELLQKAIQTSEIIKDDTRFDNYRDDLVYEDDDFELYDDTDALFKLLKEESV